MRWQTWWLTGSLTRRVTANCHDCHWLTLPTVTIAKWLTAIDCRQRFQETSWLENGMLPLHSHANWRDGCVEVRFVDLPFPSIYLYLKFDPPTASPLRPRMPRSAPRHSRDEGCVFQDRPPTDRTRYLHICTAPSGNSHQPTMNCVSNAHTRCWCRNGDWVMWLTAKTPPRPWYEASRGRSAFPPAPGFWYGEYGPGQGSDWRISSPSSCCSLLRLMLLSSFSSAFNAPCVLPETKRLSEEEELPIFPRLHLSPPPSSTRRSERTSREAGCHRKSSRS